MVNNNNSNEIHKNAESEFNSYYVYINTDKTHNILSGHGHEVPDRQAFYSCVILEVVH